MIEVILKILTSLTSFLTFYFAYKFFHFNKLYKQEIQKEIEMKYTHNNKWEKDCEWKYASGALDEYAGNLPNYFASDFLKRAKLNGRIATFLFALTITLFLTTAFKSNVNNKNSNIIDELIKGKMAYHIPDSMKIDSNNAAIVSITKSLNDSILLKTLDTINYTVKEIKVSSRIKVRLIDPEENNFKIIPLSNEEQLIDNSSNTLWKWNIIPKESGKNKIVIQASAKVLNKLGENYRDIPIYEQTIIVTSTTPQSFWHFIEKYQSYIAWICSIIIIPLVIWIVREIKNFKSKNKNRQEIGFK